MGVDSGTEDGLSSFPFSFSNEVEVEELSLSLSLQVGSQSSFATCRGIPLLIVAMWSFDLKCAFWRKLWGTKHTFYHFRGISARNPAENAVEFLHWSSVRRRWTFHRRNGESWNVWEWLNQRREAGKCIYGALSVKVWDAIASAAIKAFHKTLHYAKRQLKSWSLCFSAASKSRPSSQQTQTNLR